MFDEEPGTTNITKIEEEKDLGIIFDQTLKFSIHVAKCASRANNIVGIIKRTFTQLDKDMFLTLYKTMVRPIMEYGSCVWRPWLKKDINILERVQRRATKLIHEIKNISYKERLLKLGLPTLEYRRQRYDMIQVFKILNNLDVVENSESLLELVTVTKTRGHNMELKKKYCKSERRKNSFFFRIVDPWNNLPDEVVSAESVNIFKSRLNTHWKHDPHKFNHIF